MIYYSGLGSHRGKRKVLPTKHEGLGVMKYGRHDTQNRAVTLAFVQIGLLLAGRTETPREHNERQIEMLKYNASS